MWKVRTRQGLWAGLAVLAGLMAGGCSSPEKEAIARSIELVDTLQKRSIPGLPTPLTPAQAMEIDRARSGPGKWFVETGCFACHDVSVYGVKSYTQMGPDLSLAVDDVQKRFGAGIDDFWHTPVGTMMMVRTQLIKLSPEEEAIGLQQLKGVYAEHERQEHAKTAEHGK